MLSCLEWQSRGLLPLCQLRAENHLGEMKKKTGMKQRSPQKKSGLSPLSPMTALRSLPIWRKWPCSAACRCLTRSLLAGSILAGGIIAPSPLLENQHNIPLWAVVAPFFLPISQAQAAPQQLTPEQLRTRREKTRKELENLRTKEQQTAKDVSTLKIDLAELNRRLIATAQRIQQAEEQLTKTEARLGELEVQEDLIKGSLSRRHGEIAELLAALQRMSRQPPPVLVTRRDDALKMVRSAMMLASVFPEMKDKAERLSAQLGELVRISEEIRRQTQQLRTTKQELEKDRKLIAKLIKEKKASYAARWEQLQQIRAATQRLARREADLVELIKKASKAVAEKSALGRYKQEQAANRSVLETDKNTTVLKPSSKRIALLSPGRMKPGLPFVKTRGALPLPVRGRRVANFGDKDHYGSKLPGIRIATRPGAQVISPCDGWVVYSGKFRSYGQLLIIDAGGGYHVLLAGMSRLDVREGQFVLAGEPVAVMASPPRLAGSEAGAMGEAVKRAAASFSAAGQLSNNRPTLYVEFRKDGKPINPDPWWIKHSGALQG